MLESVISLRSWFRFIFVKESFSVLGLTSPPMLPSQFIVTESWLQQDSARSSIKSSRLILTYACASNYMKNRGSFAILFFKLLLQRFLMLLSVLPLNDLAIRFHLPPHFLCSLRIFRSSSIVHFLFMTSGERVINQRSRHCLPMRPGRPCEIKVHLLAPYLVTLIVRISSSVLVHGRFAIWLLLLNARKRLWHLISDLPRILLMRFHACSPKSLTK